MTVSVSKSLECNFQERRKNPGSFRVDAGIGCLRHVLIQASKGNETCMPESSVKSALPFSSLLLFYLPASEHLCYPDGLYIWLYTSPFVKNSAKIVPTGIQGFYTGRFLV